MKKILMNLCVCILIGVLTIASMYFFKYHFIPYFILTLTVLLNVLIIYCIYIFSNKDEYTIYKSKVNKILKTYEGIIVKSNTLPDIGDKSVMFLDDILDMVDAQSEIRKPIYYYEEENCCTFVLKDTDDVLIYIVKSFDELTSSIENAIENRKIEDAKAKDTIDKNVLKALDKTTVFVFDDKVLKVSPVRDEEEPKKTTTRKRKTTSKKEEAKTEVEETPKKTRRTTKTVKKDTSEEA